MHALRSRLPAAPKRARTGAHLAVRGERRAAKQSKAKQSRGKAKGRAKVPSAPPKAPPRRFAAHTRRPVRPTRGETRIAPPRRGNGRRPHTRFLPTKAPGAPGAAARGAARPRAEGALGSPLPPDWLKRMAFTGGSRQRDARDAMPVRARRRRVRGGRKPPPAVGAAAHLCGGALAANHRQPLHGRERARHPLIFGALRCQAVEVAGPLGGLGRASQPGGVCRKGPPQLRRHRLRGAGRRRASTAPRAAVRRALPRPALVAGSSTGCWVIRRRERLLAPRLGRWFAAVPVNGLLMREFRA